MNENNYNNVVNNKNLVRNMKSTKSIITDQSKNEALNFREILQLFNCAISQEQAWAVLYQVLHELKSLLDSNLEIIKLNQDKIDINILYFAKDGSVLFGFYNDNANYKQLHRQPNLTSSSASSLSSNLEQERAALETKVLKSVAYLIYDALDYGNNFSNEPVLETSLSHLLLLTSGHYKEFSKSRVLSEDDEGYDQEEEDTISLEKAIEICTNNVAEAEYHYKAVCRGLYAQAFELKAFLAKIEDSKEILQRSGKDTSHYCFEVLDKSDWAKLWMQVIHELRHGIKLRKVSDIYAIRRNIEYELTPFEILLDQIRARRYHLKKVPIDTLNNELKKDARDIILEFIRSRPPLKKSSLRNMNKPVIKEPTNLHEQLMNSIRNYSTPLRKISIPQMNNLNLYKYNDESLNKSNLENKKKRLLKPDKQLLNNLSSSDDDDSEIDYDEIKNLPVLEELINTSYLNNSKTIYSTSNNNSTNSQRKKRIKAPDSLKSPLTPWNDPVENWRALVTEDVLTDNNKKTNNQTNMLSRRHTMNLSDVQSISTNLSSLNIFSGFGASDKKSIKVSDNWELARSRLVTPIYFKSGPGYDDSYGFVSNQELAKKLTIGKDCLKLTFEELCHIRKVLTKAELDYLLFDNQLFQDVSKGKVCFSCRKTKFHLFNWGCKCQICQQRVCKKCLRNAQLKNGLIAQVPLFKLCPAKFQDIEDNFNKESNKDISHNSNSSLSSQTTSDENEILVISSSNEKVSNEFNHEFIDLQKQNYLLSIPNYSINNINNNNIKILDICVDCYQMMDGISVSMNNKNDNKLNYDKNDKDLFLNNENKQNNFSQKVNNTSAKTPLVNKLLPMSSTCHSTPTLNVNNNITLDVNNEISDLNFCENIDEGNELNNPCNIKNNLSRQHLKLDLQPVYTSKAP